MIRIFCGLLLAAGFVGMVQLGRREPRVAGIDLPPDVAAFLVSAALLMYASMSMLVLMTIALGDGQVQFGLYGLAGWLAFTAVIYASSGSAQYALPPYNPMSPWIWALDPGWAIALTLFTLYEMAKRKRMLRDLYS